MAEVLKRPKKGKGRESSRAREWTGNQGYIVLYQASAACCVTGRVAILLITRQ